MRYETFIALRYLRSKRRTRFISFITYISVGGIAIGVAALAIVLSTMNGLETEVRERIISMDAHLKVTTFHDQGIPGTEWPAIMDTLRAMPGVVGVTPYVEVQGILSGMRQTPAVIRGIDPATANSVYGLSGDLQYGSMDFSVSRNDLGIRYHGMLVGLTMSQSIGAVGQTGYLAVLPQGEDAMLLISAQPLMVNFQITGVFQSDLYEYDASYAYLGLDAAQELLRMGDSVTGIAVKLDDMYRVGRMKEELNRRLPYPYFIVTWIDMNKNLFSWMTIEKWAMFIALGLIILVAAFNIISTLVMVVLEKTREIGVLKAMGATRGAIQRIFLTQGMIVGVVGTVLGLILGYGFAWLQETYRIISLPPDVYFISAVPIDMRFLDGALITLVSLLISLAASVYPARRAASLVPVDAIRE